MARETLYNVAKHYVEIIERLERTRDKTILVDLEEDRVIWHNKLIQILRREGIPYGDRDHVTRLAYMIAQKDE
jgi:hypothetical protein